MRQDKPAALTHPLDSAGPTCPKRSSRSTDPARSALRAAAAALDAAEAMRRCRSAEPGAGADVSRCYRGLRRTRPSRLVPGRSRCRWSARHAVPSTQRRSACATWPNGAARWPNGWQRRTKPRGAHAARERARDRGFEAAHGGAHRRPALGGHRAVARQRPVRPLRRPRRRDGAAMPRDAPDHAASANRPKRRAWDAPAWHAPPRHGPEAALSGASTGASAAPVCVAGGARPAPACRPPPRARPRRRLRARGR